MRSIKEIDAVGKMCPILSGVNTVVNCHANGCAWWSRDGIKPDVHEVVAKTEGAVGKLEMNGYSCVEKNFITMGNFEYIMRIEKMPKNIEYSGYCAKAR